MEKKDLDGVIDSLDLHIASNDVTDADKNNYIFEVIEKLLKKGDVEKSKTLFEDNFETVFLDPIENLWSIYKIAYEAEMQTTADYFVEKAISHFEDIKVICDILFSIADWLKDKNDMDGVTEIYNKLFFNLDLYNSQDAKAWYKVGIYFDELDDFSKSTMCFSTVDLLDSSIVIPPNPKRKKHERKEWMFILFTIAIAVIVVVFIFKFVFGVLFGFDL